MHPVRDLRQVQFLTVGPDPSDPRDRAFAQPDGDVAVIAVGRCLGLRRPALATLALSRGDLLEARRPDHLAGHPHRAVDARNAGALVGFHDAGVAEARPFDPLRRAEQGAVDRSPGEPADGAAENRPNGPPRTPPTMPPAACRKNGRHDLLRKAECADDPALPGRRQGRGDHRRALVGVDHPPSRSAARTLQFRLIENAAMGRRRTETPGEEHDISRQRIDHRNGVRCRIAASSSRSGPARTDQSAV